MKSRSKKQQSSLQSPNSLLPHHTPDGDIHWSLMSLCVTGLTRTHGSPVPAPPEIVLEAAKHLAVHYQEAGKPIPDALAVLI